MLAQAFLETSDFRALRSTDHFNFIVGRRGTGKTALFLRLVAEFATDKNTLTHRIKPEEHDSLALVGLVRRVGDGRYDRVRATTRVLWRTALLQSVADDLCHHWKYGKGFSADWLRQYSAQRKQLFRLNEFQRCTEMLKQSTVEASSPEELPGMIAAAQSLTQLEAEVRAGLEAIDLRALFLFDGLDEGWGPDQTSTAVLGGLAIAIAGFKDADVPLHGELFVRDNIFRSLAALDSDYSRHIEGATLRLHWTDESLLNLVANRLRIVFEMTEVENNIRVWNRFAHRDLRDREGFRQCLQHTLYRPRDVLVLLNGAAVLAAREGRVEIVEEDIQATSKQISLDRLADLQKEYESVFPGLGIIIGSFTGSQAFATLGSVRSVLDDLLADERYITPESSDLALLAASSQLVDALYSVGFLGLEDPATRAVLFCHDGSLSSISQMPGDRRVAIHPCYWRALNISTTDEQATVALDIHDEYKAEANPQAADIRARRLGQLVSELPTTPEGALGASAYEAWVLRTCKILFAGALSNFELHPAPGGVQRRDVLATNEAHVGFWKRVLDDYSVRQVIFEAKNHDDLSGDDYRQALSYSGKQYGRLVFIVPRSDAEGLSLQARGWVKEIWDQHNVLIVSLPTGLLMRCLRKIRNPIRKDYADRALMKRLDTFERDYLVLRQVNSRRQRRR